MNENLQTSQPQRVECSAAKDPVVRLFIVAAMFIAFAVYCFVDKEEPPAAWDFKHINEAASYALHAYGPYVFVPPGVVFAVWAVVFLRRRLVADVEGIGYAGKEKIPWGDIEALDGTKLKNKGILYLHHGRGRKLTLDSWKLKNFRELVAFVEKHVPAEARAGGTTVRR